MAIVASFVLAALAAPVAADDEREIAKKPKLDRAQSSTRIVCKKVRATGSHFTRRVCHTRQKWDEMTQVARDEAQRSANQTRPSISQ